MLAPGKINIDLPKAPDAVLREDSNDAIGRFESVIGHAENPLRESEFSIHGMQRNRHIVERIFDRIKIPPAGLVRDEGESAVRRPHRLHDSFLLATRYLVLLAQ